MTEPLDVFIKMENGTYIWKASVGSLQAAKSMVEQLANRSPGEYMIFNQATNEKIVVHVQ
jgi:3-deoxy-D-manno-octulosonic-acid transferase